MLKLFITIESGGGLAQDGLVPPRCRYDCLNDHYRCRRWPVIFPVLRSRHDHYWYGQGPGTMWFLVKYCSKSAFDRDLGHDCINDHHWFGRWRDTSQAAPWDRNPRDWPWLHYNFHRYLKYRTIPSKIRIILLLSYCTEHPKNYAYGSHFVVFDIGWFTHQGLIHHPAINWQNTALIARFMGPTWGPPGANRTQVGPMLAPWTLLSGRWWQ